MPFASAQASNGVVANLEKQVETATTSKAASEERQDGDEEEEEEVAFDETDDDDVCISKPSVGYISLCMAFARTLKLLWNLLPVRSISGKKYYALHDVQ